MAEPLEAALRRSAAVSSKRGLPIQRSDTGLKLQSKRWQRSPGSRRTTSQNTKRDSGERRKKKKEKSDRDEEGRKVTLRCRHRPLFRLRSSDVLRCLCSLFFSYSNLLSWLFSFSLALYALLQCASDDSYVFEALRAEKVFQCCEDSHDVP